MKLPVEVKEQIDEAKLPVLYVEACVALEACLSIDEAKVWATKADMLAAYANMYINNEAGRQARAIKLKAFRRMGEIATEIRKTEYTPKGKAPGAIALLIDHGLNKRQAEQATRISRISKERFQELVDSSHPPSPLKASIEGIANSTLSKSYSILAGDLEGAPLLRFRSFCRKYSAKALGKELNRGEYEKVRSAVREIQEWLDELDQSFPDLH